MLAQHGDSLFLSAAITKLRDAREYTLKVAELMPEEKYSYKPVPEEMSFGGQLLHLSENMAWLCSSYLGNTDTKTKTPFTKADGMLKKKEEIIQVVKSIYDFALETLKLFPPDHLSDTVTFFAGPMNKLQIINLLNDHQTHHRAQMLVYLRLNGIKPPDYTGW
ncbi:MAG: DinB family protein [Puia sp.]|nr:DinB family protein [Puia sp.]